MPSVHITAHEEAILVGQHLRDQGHAWFISAGVESVHGQTTVVLYTTCHPPRYLLPTTAWPMKVVVTSKPRW